jgi:hypothetical protein
MTEFAPCQSLWRAEFFGSAAQFWQTDIGSRIIGAMHARSRAAAIAVGMASGARPERSFARRDDPDAKPVGLWGPAGRGTLAPCHQERRAYAEEESRKR